MENFILGKRLQDWIEEYPILADVIDYKAVSWENPKLSKTEEALSTLDIGLAEVQEAEERLERFAPLIAELFPEASKCMGFEKGIIESELIHVKAMKKELIKHFSIDFEGELFQKCDSELPVAGSIKARGGIYEVLYHAEQLAIDKGILRLKDDYRRLKDAVYKDFFGKFKLSVGSTGNLGLSIGIMGAALGFSVTVHMSADAKEWKKDLLRSKGVKVVEYASDYSKAVLAGRMESEKDPDSYFVDDENSKNLFVGYSVAALRLKKQLEAMGIAIASDRPLFVYLPCGVGGAPAGICYGLKLIFGDSVNCFFVEPTHSPCMLLGLLTGENDKVSVDDFGLDNITDADGLAVGRASGFAGRYIESLVSGVYTVADQELYKLLYLLKESEGRGIEPSAAGSFLGPIRAAGQYADYIKKQSLSDKMKHAVHIAWTTGGLFVPEDKLRSFYERGKALIKNQQSR